MTLKELLSRRSDLSTFLVHLTRTSSSASAAENLTQILREGAITAKNVFGLLKGHSDARQLETDIEESQRCVCFTETPLEYVYLLVEELQGRQVLLEPYGIAITKVQGRKMGINPIWYLDITPGHTWLTEPLNRLRDQFLSAPEMSPDLASIFPFVEQMGRGPGYIKEFWWEREWRKTGNVRLPVKFVVLCPESEIGHFEALITESDRPYCRCIDPRWSLERIIGRLAGISDSEIDP